MSWHWSAYECFTCGARPYQPCLVIRGPRRGHRAVPHASRRHQADRKVRPPGVPPPGRRPVELPYAWAGSNQAD